MSRFQRLWLPCLENHLAEPHVLAVQNLVAYGQKPVGQVLMSKMGDVLIGIASGQNFP